jgi:hypothetical protein
MHKVSVNVQQDGSVVLRINNMVLKDLVIQGLRGCVC